MSAIGRFFHKGFLVVHSGLPLFVRYLEVSALGCALIGGFTVAFLRASFKIIPSKNIVYRDYKHFDQNDFLHELDLEMNKGKFYNSANPYDDFSNLFKEITDKHAPIKRKKVRGSNASFTTKEHRKTIIDRSRLRNKYLKYPSRENFVNMKKMKNKCSSICKKSKIKYLKRSTEKGIT